MKKEENKSPQTGNRFRQASISVTFLALVFGMAGASMLVKDRDFSDNENRVLQQRPEFTSERLFDGTFTKEYEAYITDQFIGRDQWIALKVYAEKALQKKGINGVYFGKDGYLIQTHEADKVDAELVNKNVGRLQQFVSKYKGTKNVYAMIVPTASSVLKDKIPAYAQEYDQQTLISQIGDAIGKDHLIEVGDVLGQHKEEYIFYRTDHHWTSLGAYYAYVEACGKLGITPIPQSEFTKTEVTKEFLGTTYSKVNIKTTPDTITLYEQATKPSYHVALNHDKEQLEGLFDYKKLEQKDKYPVFLGGNNAYVEITGGEKNGKTLLVVKDSFAHTLVPFLAPHYEKIIMIDYRYFNESTEQLVEKEAVTDILVLYNTMNFVEDRNLLKLGR